jgi:hypothetical protein
MERMACLKKIAQQSAPGYMMANMTTIRKYLQTMELASTPNINNNTTMFNSISIIIL